MRIDNSTITRLHERINTIGVAILGDAIDGNHTAQAIHERIMDAAELVAGWYDADIDRAEIIKRNLNILNLLDNYPANYSRMFCFANSLNDPEMVGGDSMDRRLDAIDRARIDERISEMEHSNRKQQFTIYGGAMNPATIHTRTTPDSTPSKNNDSLPKTICHTVNWSTSRTNYTHWVANTVWCGNFEKMAYYRPLYGVFRVVNVDLYRWRLSKRHTGPNIRTFRRW